VQRLINNTLMLDDRGITTLSTTANYGNFLSAALTQRIQRLMASLRTKVKASCVARDKNQYRVFFSDKSAIYLTFNGSKLRSITTQAFQHDVQCIHSTEDSDGSEQMFFGSSDGFVYQMEKGTSFDGQDIEAFIYLAFNSSRMPRQLKHYQHGVFEVAGAGYAEFSFRYDLGYASADIPNRTSKPASRISLLRIGTQQYGITLLGTARRSPRKSSTCRETRRTSR
jgi:hypothetical protein